MKLALLIVLSTFLASNGVKLGADPAKSPVVNMNKKVDKVLSARAKAKQALYNQPAQAQQIESRTKQYVQRWLSFLLRRFAPSLNPAIAGMIPNMALPLLMNKRAALSTPEKIVFDSVASLKVPTTTAHPTTTNATFLAFLKDFHGYMQPLTGGFTDAGYEEMARSLLELQNVTGLLTSMASAVDFWHPSTLMEEASLDRAIASLEAQGWALAARVTRQFKPSVAKFKLFGEKVEAFGTVKDPAQYAPLMVDVADVFADALETAGVPNARSVTSICKEVANHTAVLASLSQVHFDMQKSQNASYMTDMIGQVAKAVEDAGFLDYARKIKDMTPVVAESIDFVHELEGIHNSSDVVAQAASFRSLATRATKHNLPVAVSSFYQDIAGMIETKTADFEHLAPEIGKLVNEAKVLEGANKEDLKLYANNFNSYATLVCAVDDLREFVPLCAAK